MWTRGSTRIFITALLLAWAPAAARGAILTATDGSSMIQVDPLSQNGLFNWSVNGVSQLSQQWYWVSAGGAAETSLDAFPLVDSQASGNQISLTYADQGVSFELTYTLNGTSNNESLIEETITITNSNTMGFDFKLFEYTDLDLLGDPSGDSATRSGGGILQSQDLSSVLVSASIAPDAFQIAPAFDIRDLLNDALPTNLNNTGDPSGPDDLAHAFQWNLHIDAAGEIVLTKTKSFVTAVPEPSTMLVLLLGLGAIAFARRRRSEG
jgi:hypothetical protein